MRRCGERPRPQRNPSAYGNHMDRKPKRDCPPPNHETHVRQLCPRLRQLLFLCRRSLPALAEIIVFVSAVTLARRQLPPGASSQPGVQCRIPSLCRLAYSPIVQHLAQPVAGALSCRYLLMLEQVFCKYTKATKAVSSTRLRP